MKTKESLEIPALVAQIKGLFALNESYVFSEDETSEEQPLDQPLEQPAIQNLNKHEHGSSNSKDKIKQIRVLSLELILTLDPSRNVEEYKSIKSIWDLCDKLLADKQPEKKEFKQNNNI